jgi:hypothetical protein
MHIAEMRVEQIQGKILKDYKNQEKFKALKVELREGDNERRQKHQQKLHIAHLNYSNHLKQLDKRSLSSYSLKLKEVEEQ